MRIFVLPSVVVRQQQAAIGPVLAFPVVDPVRRDLATPVLVQPQFLSGRRVEGNNRVSRQASAKVTKEMVAGYHSNTYPDGDPGPRPYDRSALFNWHSRNKLAACMNLDTPQGHEAALRLIQISDVLVENNTNGVLEKLGLGHETLLELNPRHPLVSRMQQRHGADAADSVLRDAAELVFGLALLAEGSELPDPVRFSRAATEVLGKVV